MTYPCIVPDVWFVWLTYGQCLVSLSQLGKLLELLVTSGNSTNCCSRWNEIVIIFMKFSALAAPEVVKMTTSAACNN